MRMNKILLINEKKVKQIIFMLFACTHTHKTQHEIQCKQNMNCSDRHPMKNYKFK